MAAAGGGGGGDDGLAFWMRNLYEMNWRDGDGPQGDGGGGGGQSAGPMFTPRGTLSLQPSAPGTSAAAVAPPMAELQFATDWVEQVFVTPRAGASADADVDARMVDAANWLQARVRGRGRVRARDTARVAARVRVGPWPAPQGCSPRR